ncbi:MAG: hypothetical protein ACOC16_01780 [Nanoarchaeota archaeon]
MEDDYELISKQHIQDLRAENKKLKEELSLKDNLANNDSIKDLILELTNSIHGESQKERELILENLNEIKDLNKSTLDNLLENTQQLDSRLESTVNTISGLVSNLITLIDSLNDIKEHEEAVKKEETSNKSHNINFKDILEDNSQKNEYIIEKLLEIDVFIKNLRVLLSYIKPSNVTIEKPIENHNNHNNLNSSTHNQPHQNNKNQNIK